MVKHPVPTVFSICEVGYNSKQCTQHSTKMRCNGLALRQHAMLQSMCSLGAGDELTSGTPILRLSLHRHGGHARSYITGSSASRLRLLTQHRIRREPAVRWC